MASIFFFTILKMYNQAENRKKANEVKRTFQWRVAEVRLSLGFVKVKRGGGNEK
jgi:hypothetical protein